MLGGVAKAIFGSSNDRYVKSIMKIVAKINDLEDTISVMDDERLKQQTPLFRDRLLAGETLDDILPEAFATVREASKRVMGMRHFDVQMVGGIVLHRGEIAEMRTGEGKTLTETLACYLNALEGNGDAPKGDDDAPKGDDDANPAGADADQADPDAPKGDADASDAKTDADGDDDPDADADGADEEE